MNHGEQIVVYKNVFLRKTLTLFALFCGGVGSGNAQKPQQLLDHGVFSGANVLTSFNTPKKELNLNEQTYLDYRSETLQDEEINQKIFCLIKNPENKNETGVEASPQENTNPAPSSPKNDPSDSIKDFYCNYFRNAFPANLKFAKSPDSLLQDTVNSMVRTTYRDEIQDFVKTLKHLKDGKIPGFTDITDYQARAEEIVRSQHQPEIQKFKTFLSQFIKGRSNHPTDYSTRPFRLNPFWEQLKHKALSHFSSLKGALEEGKNQIKNSPSLQSLSYLKDQTQSFFTKTYQSLQNITRRALFNGSYFLETSWEKYSSFSENSYQESKKAIKRSVSLQSL